MNIEKFIYACVGAITGMWQYLMIGKIVEAGITAFVCGFLGAGAKWAFDQLVKKYFKK